jgi:hypothetical protein
MNMETKTEQINETLKEFLLHKIIDRMYEVFPDEEEVELGVLTPVTIQDIFQELIWDLTGEFDLNFINKPELLSENGEPNTEKTADAYVPVSFLKGIEFGFEFLKKFLEDVEFEFESPAMKVVFDGNVFEK